MSPQDTADVLQKLIQTEDNAAWWSAVIASLGAIVGAILGATLAVGIPYFVAWRNSPCLHLSYSKDVDSFDLDFHQEGTLRNRRYITLQLGNRGKALAKNARVYLIKLEKVHQDGTEDVPLGTSFQLAWPGWTFRGKDLPVGISLAVEVVSVDKVEPGWIFQFEGKERNQDKVRSYKGTYRLTLMAVADNAKPVISKLSVVYNGDWSQFQPTKLQT